MRLTTSLLLPLLLFVGSAFAGGPPQVSNTAILKTTLIGFNLKDPTADAKRNAAHGDLRLIGVVDYACHPPGREGLDLQPLADLYGTRCLEGMSDVIESKEYEMLYEQARTYGIKYNQAMADLIHQAAGSNNSFKPNLLRYIKSVAKKPATLLSPLRKSA